MADTTLIGRMRSEAKKLPEGFDRTWADGFLAGHGSLPDEHVIAALKLAVGAIPPGAARTWAEKHAGA